MIRFMVAFAETLYRLNREAVHLFVDEADAFAPQARNYGGDENRMLGAMEDIVRRGRKRGIGCTLITQRPAVLNKNVLTQCEVLVACGWSTRRTSTRSRSGSTSTPTRTRPRR
jgi:DNA helicase HerA-like ATPase